MKRTLSREESRELDRRAIEDFGIPGIVLMENAGRGVVDYLFSLGIKGPVVICCGKGNNAGDGFVIARHLDSRNIPVRVLIFSNEEFRGDAKINYDILVKSLIPIIHCDSIEKLSHELTNAEWIIDALFGTGLVGPVKPPYDQVIETMNAATHAKMLAVDIPSGLDCDTGSPLGATIKAQYTLTFVALKKGFANPESQRYLGEVQIVDIGIPRVLFKS